MRIKKRPKDPLRTTRNMATSQGHSPPNLFNPLRGRRLHADEQGGLTDLPAPRFTVLRGQSLRLTRLMEHEKNCRHCGTPIVPPKEDRKKPKRFCDLQCYVGFTKANPTTKFCDLCDDDFPDPTHDPRTRFCSQRCRREAWYAGTSGDHKCLYCPREAGENRMVSKTRCRACDERRRRTKRCHVTSCSRTVRVRGFGANTKPYCPRHEGPRLWRANEKSVRILLVDELTDLCRVVYRKRDTKVSTADWDGRLLSVAHERQVIMLVSHEAFLSREVRWAVAIKGALRTDPKRRLEHHPWWLFLVEDFSAVRSLRDQMAVCLKIGSPADRIRYSNEFDVPTESSDRRWERFKRKLRGHGIEHERVRLEVGQLVALEFPERQWETFIAFADQRALQKQEGSWWV